ncbi:MAG: N-acetylglucosamine-6-phosphate deacetylase [Halanaerobiaceae bacterium]|nr:N-acetylglucosamine-6-phosphate deacetylase [Halanaerobiaceae bacterium]
MLAIKNAKIILQDSIQQGDIVFSNKIIEIAEEIKTDNIEFIDGSGMYLAPGFIDIHIHGAAGRDTMDEDPQAINEISRSIIKSGVTSFLPTTTTMSGEDIQRALRNIREAMKNGTEGARVLGAYVEGPFVSKEYKGAQNEVYIRNPGLDLIKPYLDIIKIVTIAPELEGARELIEYLSKRQIIVSAGHSAAAYEEIIDAREWGLTHCTHLFNAMTGLHHRDPGVAGAVLVTDIGCELIADFVHVHPAVIKIIFKVKKTSEIFLITDQMRAGTLGNGKYDLGGQWVTVRDNEARLEDGTLAGSVLTLDQAVRNIASLDILSLPELISLVTQNPARILGLSGETGKLAPGYTADMVLLDEKLYVKRVFKEGKEVYRTS